MESFKICGVSSYLPEKVAPNSYFAQLCQRDAEWFAARTGIESRRRAADGENVNTMGIKAVESLLQQLSFPVSTADLVIGGTYTPWDTVGTMAHRVQRHFHIANAKAFHLSSACSSFINALEIARLFASAGKSKRALIVVAEHNSAYASDKDDRCGHLWGDGAAAVLASTAPEDKGILELLDVESHGLGHLGMGPDGVYLAKDGGLVMSDGRDVFNHACREMERVAREVLERNNIQIGDVALFVPHQANRRIVERVAVLLKCPLDRVACTVDVFGNTGCASIPITYAASAHRITPGDLVLCAAFGGGYSSGAALFGAL